LRKIADFFEVTIGYLLGEEHADKLREAAAPHRATPSTDETGYRNSLRALAAQKTRPEIYLAEQIHEMLDEETPRRENYIVARAGAMELIDVLDQIIREKKDEPNLTPDEIASRALKKGVADVKNPGVIYPRSGKAASTSGKTSSRASHGDAHPKDQP
jgi:hypothetical protein